MGERVFESEQIKPAMIAGATVRKAAEGIGYQFGPYVCPNCNAVHFGIWVAGELVVDVFMSAESAVTMAEAFMDKAQEALDQAGLGANAAGPATLQ